jgi:hypothetical protein
MDHLAMSGITTDKHGKGENPETQMHADFINNLIIVRHSELASLPLHD